MNHVGRDFFEDEYGMKHPFGADGPSYRFSPDQVARTHVGKGPKGHDRRERLIEEASEILFSDSEVDASEIKVEVQGDILVLNGEVKTRKEKKRAEALLEGIRGIRDVHNHLFLKKQNIQGWIPDLKEVS